MNKVRFKIKNLTIMNLILLMVFTLFVFPVSATSSWSKPRPSKSTAYDEKIENADTDGHASVGVGVHVCEYTESVAGYDYLHFRISTSANTRVGIAYNINVIGYLWEDVFQPTNIYLGDNDGEWLPLPFSVLFYGVEYQSVWVCSNGFLSFDYPSTSPIPQSIPDMSKPNSTVAVFWRDLDPSAGGSITYGTTGSAPDRYFVVSWNDVPNKGNDVPQSFQVVIAERNPINPFSLNYHNEILFQYKHVTKDYATTVGVEDQVGDRGSSYNYHSLHNELALKIRYPSPGYRLHQLKIKLSKSDSYATIDLLEGCPPYGIGGYNVVLEDPGDPYGSSFLIPIEAAATVLLTGEAAIMFGILLITAESALTLAEALSVPDFESHDALQDDNEAYVRAMCQSEEPSGGDTRPFDATLAAPVMWFFTDDPNDRSHYLTVTAELVYYDLTYSRYHTISTSVTLSMYIGGDAGTSRSTYATWWPQQRKTFYAAGRYWAFYSDNTNMVYKSSLQGSTWTEPTVVRPASSGTMFSVWFDGQYVHYACQEIIYLTAKLTYRKGLPQSNGNILWTTTEQTVATGDYAYADPFVSVDSSGYPWISYVWTNNFVTYYPCVTKSALNTGEWVTASGFPYQLSTTSTSAWRSAVIPLTAGKMLAIYAHAGSTVKARRWSGSAWDTEKATTSTIEGGWCFSAVNGQGDYVHVVFLKDVTYDIIHVRYSPVSNAWGIEVKVQPATTSLSAPVLSINKLNNNLHCFWAGSPTANHIYYKKFSAGTWDASPADWIDESEEVLTGNDRLTCFYEAHDGKTGVLYMTRTFDPYVPYNVKYAVL